MSIKKSNKWIWIIVALVVVAAIGVWCGYNAGVSENGVESTFKVSTVTALLAGIYCPLLQWAFI